MSAQRLNYALQLSQGTQTSLTYLNVGQSATLTVVVSNAGAPVDVTNLVFDLSPFGNAASDLAGSADDITPLAPSGWKVDPATSFGFTPVSGSISIGTSPVTFTLQVNVNAVAGIARVAITEVSSAGTAHPAPIPITKMPPSFVLANLSASPELVEPGGTVTLSWSATPGQLYTVGFPGGTDTVTPPSGGTASWISPPVQTAYASVTYTVSASTQVSGQTLSAEVSTTVQVDVPQVVSFDQPPACYSTPATLHWQTVNADYCVLYANGSVVDQHAPANPGENGYPVYPKAHVTAYQLHAFHKKYSVSSQTVYVTLYNWAYERTFTPGFLGYEASLALTTDGRVLYYGDNFNIFAIDTSAFTILGHAVVRVYAGGPEADGVCSLAVSKDGRKLFVGMFPGVDGLLHVYDTANLSAPSTTINVTTGPVAMSPDGKTLYMAAGVASFGGGVSAIDTSTHAVLRQAGGRYDQYLGLSLSRDGSTLYGVRVDNQLVTIDTSTLHATAVTTVAGAPCVLTADDATLYCGQFLSGRFPDAQSNTVDSRTIPGFAVTRSVKLPATSGPGISINALAVDPSGGLFLSLMMPDGTVGGQPAQVTLFFVDPNTGACTLMDSVNQQIVGPGLIVDDAGQRAYYANGTAIMVFSSTGGGVRVK